jgi:hypothetical protein
VEKKQTLGLIGSIALMIGVFSPLVSMPMMGAVNYFQNGKGLGAIVFILALVSLALSLFKKYSALWLTGLASVGSLIFSFIKFQIVISDMKSSASKNLEGNPFRGIADMAVNSIQLQWGWGLLLTGGILLIASAAIDVGSNKLLNKYWSIRKLLTPNVVFITGCAAMVFVVGLMRFGHLLGL